ncbi:MAG: FAD-dependent monooxygenase [Verrucomicrobia bacterium]|nr:FAD-dependent monooxygenase [Verrucomicrobiota bacterium]
MAQPQVLIVGAGPTGLVLAFWLTKVGVPVRIIDKLGAPGTTSRAVVFHVRSLEFYRQLGIDQFAVRQGVEAKVGNLWLRGSRVGQIRFGDLGVTLSRYSFPLIFPQDLHEKMLIEQLSRLNVHVERETELVDFTLTEDGVSATLQKASGAHEAFHVPYLAGCDGARSTVRERLQIKFPGGTYSDTYYVADIEATGPIMNGQVNIALDEADFLAVFPMKGEGRARLVGAVRQELPTGRSLAWNDVSQRIIHHLKMKVKEVKWFSSYRVHHRVASTFTNGRAFLLGDAAHIHSPVGGQGMNTGIGDAVNLAWKLAAVLKARSPASLLETYEPERIAFARQLVATTDRVFAFVSARGPFATWTRLHIVPRLIPFLFRFAAVRRNMYRIVSQVAIQYPQSPLSHGPAGTRKGGQRLPWLQVDHPSSSSDDNFACFSALNWQIHFYGEGSSDLKTLCDARGIQLHHFPWTPAAHKAGLIRNAAYILRPDEYIGIVVPDADPKKIILYLETWLLNKDLPEGED